MAGSDLEDFPGGGVRRGASRPVLSLKSDQLRVFFTTSLRTSLEENSTSNKKRSGAGEGGSHHGERTDFIVFSSSPQITTCIVGLVYHNNN